MLQYAKMYNEICKKKDEIRETLKLQVVGRYEKILESAENHITIPKIHILGIVRSLFHPRF